VALALDALGVSAEVEINIEKRLPVQGGLGAGSANAVAALLGLENELGAECLVRRVGATWETTRLEIAAQVGSDVPLFLIGGTVLGQDRGQQVSALPDIEPVWCVLATPDIGVSTPQAFRDWDTLCAAEGLTAEASADKLKELNRAYASAFGGSFHEAFRGEFFEGQQGVGSSGVLSNEEDLAGRHESALVRTGISSWIQNDFERVVFPQHPSLAEIKRILAGPGTPEAACQSSSLVASLSGSGSALFGLYPSRETAEAARQRLLSAGIACQLTRTLPRPAYWSEMLLHKED
jgi:4-diphosphocytidyl-2-C-methyl-D-erythritol kinase